MQTRAAVLRAVGTPRVVEPVDLAPLRSHDVLVRIRGSGLCHTDLEVMRGSLQLPCPSYSATRAPAWWRLWGQG